MRIRWTSSRAPRIGNRFVKACTGSPDPSIRCRTKRVARSRVCILRWPAVPHAASAEAALIQVLLELDRPCGAVSDAVFLFLQGRLAHDRDVAAQRIDVVDDIG